MTPMERIEGELSDAQKRIAELEYLLARQAKAAQQGIDAAKAAAYAMEQNASRLYAECSPQALESEREANAVLTERVSELEEREQSLWETLIKIADELGIDYQEARKQGGKPSDVYIKAITGRDLTKQAEVLETAEPYAECKHDALMLSLTASKLRHQAEALNE